MGRNERLANKYSKLDGWVRENEPKSYSFVLEPQ